MRCTCILPFLVVGSAAFSLSPPSLAVVSSSFRQRETKPLHLSKQILFMSPDDTDTKDNDSVTIGDNIPQMTSSLDEPSGVPLDIPSPILLSSAMVLAIASVGSIFELVGGSPQLGFIPSAALALLGSPLCIFLFYAAIMKGNAETLADDEQYKKKNNSGYF